MYSMPTRPAILSLDILSTTSFLILAGALFALSPICATATTVAGRTVGSFAVSPSGAATYKIPIWAPPGPNGMQPNISLVYDSQVGGGLGRSSSAVSNSTPGRCLQMSGVPGGRTTPVCILPYSQASAGYGLGWTIQGLSSIYRCNLTFAQDASPAAVQLAISDGYCMDGQRLRLTSGTYGAAGSTYQTEIANFVVVTAYGSAGGNGPSYWIAQDRNGRTYTYGNGGSSQVLATGTSTASAWMLNEVSDPPGNTMTISYNTANGSAVPATISWTPSSHGSSSYNYTMTFAYGTSVPQSSYYGYVAGTAVQNANLLSSITIEYSGTTVKKYVLTYQTSPTTGRDELKQVQECSDSAGSNCLLPTVITYQSGTAGVSATATSLNGSFTTFDFNGDGYPDLFYLNGSTYYVAFGSASGYGTGVSTGIPSTASQILGGNLNGQGSQDGFLAAVSGTWYYYTWNGSSFTQTSTGLAYDSTAVQYLLADVNGDGLPDLVAAYFINDGSGNGYDYKVYVLPNTGGGSSVSFGSAALAYELGPDALILAAQPVLASNTANEGFFTQAYGNLRKFDFNGDGRDDLSMQTITKTPLNCTTNCTYHINAYEMISGGSASSPSFSPSEIYTATASTAVPVAFINFNSDACTDYVIANTIYVAGCNGSAPATVAVSKTVIGAMDWDGDGRTDLMVANGSTVGVYLSTGNGVGNLISTSIPYNSGYKYFTISDPNGDGQDAFGYSTGTNEYYYPHNGAGTPPDLATSFTDGYGNSASPTYVSLVQNNYTENGYGTATYPDEVWIAPTYVVNEVIFSDPSSSSGGTYNQQFWYYGGWTNLQGRGWEGFYATRELDSRNGLYDYNYFQRNFPYSGTHNEEIVSNGSFYPSQWVGTLTYNELSSTQYQQRFFPYFSNVTSSQKEVGGSENGDLITTISTNFTYDNYGNATSVATTETDDDPASPYNGQSWTTTITNTPVVSPPLGCTGLFTETQVAYTSSLSGSGSVTRTKTFTPDTTNCRYTQIVTEPNSSQFKVTETLGYDSFGNLSSDTVTGVNMAARTATINWTTASVTTGQFPMVVTDPTNAQTQLNYNLSYGVLSGITDPNNLLTTWAHTDGFGRLTQETRRDGTYTQYAYQNCSGTSGCLVGSNGLVVGHTVYNTDASVQSSGTTYLDSVDRQLVANQVMLSGSYSRNEQRYDSLGRVSQNAFPCTWTSLTTTCSYWTTNSYDVLNRLTQSQRPISSTNSNPQTTTYAYAGRTTTVTDPQSNARTTVTDVNGWLRQTKDPMGYTVTVAYDSAGSKTKVTDSLGNTLWSGTYNYGLAAFPATSSDMDMGNWSYTFDALGEETAWTDAKSQSFSATYDALSRLTTRTDPDLYTQLTWGSSASSHNIGKLQSACTGTGTSCTSSGYSDSESYDSLGRRLQRSITISGYSAFTYTWGYNATTGLLNTLTYPVSTSSYALELQYAYANGILQSVTDTSDTPNVIVWTANTMDPAGHLTEETLGNGIVTSRTYDAVTQWLGTAQSGVGGGAGVKNLAFLYDEMGNLTQRQDNNLGLTENIYYDNDYRFSYSKLNGTQNLAVTYDGTGNITSRSDVAAGASWTYDPTHKHEVTQAGNSSYQYSYDANGNAITRQGSTISWSSYNYPTAINAGSGSTAETVAFSYGPLRQRWQQMYTGNGTQETTYYVGRLLEVVASGSVTDYRHYINVAGEHVAVYSRKSSGTNTFSYLLSDHEAGVSSVTNSSGAQVVGESFDAFGNRRNPTTWSGAPSNTDLTTIAGVTREGYTFQTALGLWMGMNHMNGRVEDSVTGRMLSGDPTVPNLGDSQSYNRFTYVNNNPLTLTDPSGFCPDDPSAVCTSYAPPPPGPPPDMPPGYTYWTCVYTTDGWDCGGGSSGGPGAGAFDNQPGRAAPGGPNDVGGGPQQIPCRPGEKCKQDPTKCGKSPGDGNSDGSDYVDRYLKFVSDNAIDVGPYAAALAGGLWPKSLAPATGGTGPLLGSTNPLTSVPRALGVPGSGSAIVRGGAATIGLATIGIGFYDITVELEGFIYALPDQGNNASPPTQTGGSSSANQNNGSSSANQNNGSSSANQNNGSSSANQNNGSSSCGPGS
jgi:RHS repeat-associated protein